MFWANPPINECMDVSGVALDGLNRAQAALESVAKRVSGGGDSGDAVGLSTDAVALIQAKNDFAANIGVLKTADEMDRSSLSLLG